MPGSFNVVSPTVIASEATTKNQPPDMDIIVFHTRPGTANGTSSRQNRCHGDRRKCRPPPPDRAARCLQRLIEAERHVPGLAGEDREDGRAVRRPAPGPGNRPMKKTTVKVRKPRIGTDCRMSSAGIMTSSACRLLAASVREGEGEDQRGDDRREHAQRRPQRIFGRFQGSRLIDTACGALSGTRVFRATLATATIAPNTHRMAAISHRFGRRRAVARAG